MKQIQLTQEKFALVDDEDFDFLNQWKWYYGDTGYAMRSSWKSKNNIRMHRLIMKAPIHLEVDHRNGNKLDNQKENLRCVTHQSNGMNRGPQKGNRTGYKGVKPHSKSPKYQAQIQVSGKQIYLGLFLTAEEAAKIYDEAALRYFGEFAFLNFPEHTNEVK